MSTDPTQVEGLRILQALVAKAVVDTSFRNRLIQSPTQELQNAGLEVPPGVDVHIHVNTDTDIHLVIPSCPPLAPTETNVTVLAKSHHFV